MEVTSAAERTRTQHSHRRIVPQKTASLLTTPLITPTWRSGHPILLTHNPGTGADDATDISTPLQCSGITLSLSSRAAKVPLVSSDVDEDRNTAVRLIARLGQELDPVREQAAVAGVDVVDAKDQSDASGELRSNCCALALAVGLSKQ